MPQSTAKVTTMIVHFHRILLFKIDFSLQIHQQQARTDKIQLEMMNSIILRAHFTTNIKIIVFLIPPLPVIDLMPKHRSQVIGGA